jgi:hypothetical protein
MEIVHLSGKLPKMFRFVIASRALALVRRSNLDIGIEENI